MTVWTISVSAAAANSIVTFNLDELYWKLI